MELAKAMRQAGAIRILGLGAAALWLGAAVMVAVPRAVHAQDAAVSSDNSAPDGDAVVGDDDSFGAAAAIGDAAVTPITLTGSWSGVATNNRHGNGTVDIDFTSQVRNVVQGTWSTVYGDSTSLGGSASGKVNGKTLSLTMDDSTVSRKCRIKFNGKITLANGVAEEIKGKYSIIACFKKKSSGTFDLTPVTP
jgi:hypothetical protein